MPDFDFRVASGTETVAWSHEALNHRGRHVHRYRAVRPVALPALADVVIQCVVGSVVAPLDVDLGGRLFTVVKLIWSGSFPFGVTQAVGQSSLITLSFAEHMLGHQEILIRRPSGGAIALSFEVEALAG